VLWVLLSLLPSRGLRWVQPIQWVPCPIALRSAECTFHRPLMAELLVCGGWHRHMVASLHRPLVGRLNAALMHETCEENSPLISSAPGAFPHCPHHEKKSRFHTHNSARFFHDYRGGGKVQSRWGEVCHGSCQLPNNTVVKWPCTVIRWSAYPPTPPMPRTKGKYPPTNAATQQAQKQYLQDLGAHLPETSEVAAIAPPTRPPSLRP